MGQTWQGDHPPACFAQFQFVNSYLSLFYIGFYLKDMERLKEVRAWPKAVPPRQLAVGPDRPKGSKGSPAPPFLLHPSLLSVHLSVCSLSACHAPPHLSVHLSVGPSTAPDRPVPVPEPRAAALGGAGPARGPAVPPAPPLPPGPGLGAVSGRGRVGEGGAGGGGVRTHGGEERNSDEVRAPYPPPRPGPPGAWWTAGAAGVGARCCPRLQREPAEGLSQWPGPRRPSRAGTARLEGRSPAPFSGPPSSRGGGEGAAFSHYWGWDSWLLSRTPGTGRSRLITSNIPDNFSAPTAHWPCSP